MKKYIFFIIFCLFFISPASSYTLNRSVNFISSEFNDAYIFNKVEVTLIPSDYEHFNNPGYYITENIPSSLEFISTNADWYNFNNTNNRLSLLKLLPLENNLSLKYILKIPNKVSTYTIYGIWKDDNKNSFPLTTEISVNKDMIVYKNNSSSKNASGTEKTKKVDTVNKVSSTTEQFVSIMTNPVKNAYQMIENLDSGTFDSIYRSFQLLTMIILLIVVISIKYIFTTRKVFKRIILSIRNGKPYLGDQIITMPKKVEINSINLSKFPVIAVIKAYPNRNIIVKPKIFLIMPKQKISFTISFTDDHPNRIYDFTNKVEIITYLNK